MCVKEKHCELWVSLYSVGIPFELCLKEKNWYQMVEVPCHQSMQQPAVYIHLPTVKLTCLQNVAHGQFGYIDLARYDTIHGSKEVYVKRPILHGYSLLREACIQKLVGEHLQRIGYAHGAPTVERVFRLQNGSVCFAMEQIEGACTLDKYMEAVPVAQLPHVIVDCLLQLCGMKFYLTQTLGMNHRDLKPSNCLIVEHEAPVPLSIQMDREVIEIQTKRSLTLIDFGFACVGSPVTRQSYVALSTVYSKEDPCPKEGRDLYVFLGLVYIDYHRKLPPNLLALFEAWLEVPGSNLCTLMRKDGEHSKQWLYFMAGNERILSFQSCPQRIIRDLMRVFHS